MFNIFIFKKYSLSMNKLRFPYSRADLNKSDIRAVVKVLEKQYLAQGEVVKNFEDTIQKI